MWYTPHRLAHSWPFSSFQAARGRSVERCRSKRAKPPSDKDRRFLTDTDELKLNIYRGDGGQRLMVFPSFEGVGFPHGRKYGRRNRFDNIGNGGHRRRWGNLTHQGDRVSFPLLQHTCTSDISISAWRKSFTTNQRSLLNTHHCREAVLQFMTVLVSCYLEHELF